MDDKAALQRLLDRQAIQDCLLRYTRGVDRLDRELLISAYHADAIDDHGAFVGSPAAFADWALPHHREHQSCTYHLILNHSCELDRDSAHGETYCVYVGVNRNGTIDLIGNRYLDRLERREGNWAILRRVCVVEWASSLPGAAQLEPNMRAAVAALMAGSGASRDPGDISYRRPLDITKPRTDR
ncbi:MAG: nuclear transport factor 2 family protein [Nevskia sp.]|nr:nuclear transport factor 2 family protein [Nevskia sp.]